MSPVKALYDIQRRSAAKMPAGARLLFDLRAGCIGGLPSRPAMLKEGTETSPTAKTTTSKPESAPLCHRASALAFYLSLRNPKHKASSLRAVATVHGADTNSKAQNPQPTPAPCATARSNT